MSENEKTTKTTINELSGKYTYSRESELNFRKNLSQQSKQSGSTSLHIKK